MTILLQSSQVAFILILNALQRPLGSYMIQTMSLSANSLPMTFSLLTVLSHTILIFNSNKVKLISTQAFYNLFFIYEMVFSRFACGHLLPIIQIIKKRKHPDFIGDMVFDAQFDVYEEELIVFGDIRLKLVEFCGYREAVLGSLAYRQVYNQRRFTTSGHQIQTWEVTFHTPSSPHLSISSQQNSIIPIMLND